jgi:hypothetical protein
MCDFTELFALIDDFYLYLQPVHKEALSESYFIPAYLHYCSGFPRCHSSAFLAAMMVDLRYNYTSYAER